MKTKTLYVLLIIVSLFIVGCKKDNIKEVKSSVKIVIDEKEFIIDLEDNETVKSFINMLPIELMYI